MSNPMLELREPASTNTLTSPFESIEEPVSLPKVPLTMHVTAIELTILVVFMIVLIVLLIWFFIASLDFALQYFRDTLEKEAVRKANAEIMKRDMESEEGNSPLISPIDEGSSLMQREWKGRQMGKQLSWAIEKGKVRKLENDIERRMMEERLEERLKDAAGKSSTSAMEIDPEGNPRRRSAE